MAKARRVTVGTEATPLQEPDDATPGERVTIWNPTTIGGVTNTVDLFIGGEDVDTVDGAGGLNARLAPGDSFTDTTSDTREVWYGRVATGTLVVTVLTGGGV